MTINESTQLLSKGASVKLLTDMLAQAEEEKRDLLDLIHFDLLPRLTDEVDPLHVGRGRAQAAIEAARSN